MKTQTHITIHKFAHIAISFTYYHLQEWYSEAISRRKIILFDGKNKTSPCFDWSFKAFSVKYGDVFIFIGEEKKFYDDDNMLTDWAKFTIHSLLVYILVTNTQYTRKHI